MTTAREIMNPGTQCIGANDTLDKAAQLMRELDVGSLPICGEDNRLRGIITDRDIVVKCIAAGEDPRNVRAEDLAQGKPVTVDADADVNQVLSEMTGAQVKRVPVIESHRLVGMISEADLARTLSENQLAAFVELVYGRA